MDLKDLEAVWAKLYANSAKAIDQALEDAVVFGSGAVYVGENAIAHVSTIIPQDPCTICGNTTMGSPHYGINAGGNVRKTHKSCAEAAAVRGEDPWTWDTIRKSMEKALDGPPAPPAPPAATEPAKELSDRDKAVHRALGMLGRETPPFRQGYSQYRDDE